MHVKEEKVVSISELKCYFYVTLRGKLMKCLFWVLFCRRDSVIDNCSSGPKWPINSLKLACRC